MQRNARSQTIHDEEEDEDIIQERGNGEWTMTDLTDNGVKAFNLDLTWYKQLETAYKEENQAVEKLTKWVLQTVSPAYKSTCCGEDDLLWQWHQNLENRCALTKTDEKTEVLASYKQAIKPPRNIREASAWVNRWEDVMARGLKQGLSTTQDPVVWVPDLLQAIGGILPVWTTMFRQTRRQAIADGSLKFREVGNDLRQEIAALGVQKTVRATKGAFATTYDGVKDHGSEKGDAHAAEDQIPLRRGATGSRRGTGEKRNLQPVEDPAQGCPACRMPHALAKCFYVFPDQAFEGFKPRSYLKKRAEEALENDADLQAQVRALKGPRSKSKSKTPRPTKEEAVEEVED
jgi:hypothetical protein